MDELPPKLSGALVANVGELLYPVVEVELK